jgi:hypothetical protein
VKRHRFGNAVDALRPKFGEYWNGSVPIFNRAVQIPKGSTDVISAERAGAVSKAAQWETPCERETVSLTRRSEKNLSWMTKKDRFSTQGNASITTESQSRLETPPSTQDATISDEGLRERLLAIRARQPSPGENLNDLEARKTLRLADIAALLATSKYRLVQFMSGRGKDPDLPRKLGEFFHLLDAGLVEKLVPTGLGTGRRKPGAVPGHSVLQIRDRPVARPPTLRVDTTATGPKLSPL